MCPRCSRPLSDWLLRDSYDNSVCPNCQSPLQIYCFPALYRVDDKVDPALLTLAGGDACCYEHAEKKACALCSHCGRFLCALCEVPLGQQTLCPDCLTGQKLPSLQRDSLIVQRTKFDSISLALATWPLLLFYFTIITAPLSFLLAIYAWNRPTSLVRHGRWRIYAAMTLSSLEIAGMVAFIVFLVTQVREKM